MLEGKRFPFIERSNNEELIDMTEREKQLSELRRKIAEGTEQLRQGEIIEGELVFQQIQDKLKQMELI